MEIIEITKFLEDLKRCERGVLNFSEDEFYQMDSTYTIIEFSGESDKIYRDSSEAIKKGLSFLSDFIYFILFINYNDRIEVMKAIPMDEIRSLALKEKYGLYKLSHLEGNLPLKLIFIFK